MADTLTNPIPNHGAPAPMQIGPYRVERELGRGGMGIVYLARHQEVGRRVALKVLAAAHTANEKALERFEREVRVVARLRDPNIVPIYDVGRFGGVPYFTMEFVEGRTLHDVIDALRRRPVSVDQLRGRDLADSVFTEPVSADLEDLLRRPHIELACHVVACIAGALAHVHAQGVVHRDVKPKNILLARDGRVLLFDFGLARVDTEAGMTVTGEFLGTPHYVSPEQLDPPETGIDERTDIYSLGVTLYELLTLKVPFDGESPQQIFRRIAGREPRSPRRLNAGIPRDLDTVCTVAMAKDRARRYPSAGDFAADLRRFLGRQPVFARPVGPITRAALWVRRKPAVAALLLSALLLAGTLAVNWRQRRVIRDVSGERDRERQLHAVAELRYGQLLVQQGRWDEALHNLDLAAASALQGSVELLISRVEALEGARRERAAVAELQQLRGRRDLGEHAARVALLAADLAVDRLRDPTAGLAEARTALDSGALAPADAAFAQALLADDGGRALWFLEETLALNPLHRRALEMIGPTLLSLGRGGEARRLAERQLGLQSGSPSACLFAALAHGTGGDLAAAAAATSRVRDQLGSGVVAGLAAWSRHLARVAGAPAALLQGLFAGSGLGVDGSDLLLSLAALLTGVPVVDDAGAVQEWLRFRLPPVLARGFAPLVQALDLQASSGRTVAASAAGGDDLKPLLTAAAGGESDGLILFLRGVLRAGEGDLDGAVVDLEAAGARPSFMPLRRVAAFYLIECRRRLAARQGEAVRAAVRAAIVAAIGDLLAVARLEEGAAAYLLGVASEVGAGDLAMEIGLRARRESR